MNLPDLGYILLTIFDYKSPCCRSPSKTIFMYLNTLRVPLACHEEVVNHLDPRCSHQTKINDKPWFSMFLSPASPRWKLLIVNPSQAGTSPTGFFHFAFLDSFPKMILPHCKSCTRSATVKFEKYAAKSGTTTSKNVITFLTSKLDKFE